MLHDYVRYAAAEGERKSQLEKISDFIHREAKVAISAGIVGLYTNTHYNNAKLSRGTKTKTVFVTQNLDSLNYNPNFSP